MEQNAACRTSWDSWSNSTVDNDDKGKQRDLLQELTGLSSSDKALLRRCWHHLVKHKGDVSVEIFNLIFKQCPETKKLFKFANDEQSTASSRRAKDDNAMQFHALRFIQIIESMIDHLHEPQAVEPILYGLGQMHLRFRDKFGFQPYFWSVFCECTLFVFRERLKHRIDDTDQAVILWRIILSAIKQKMKQGFHEGDKKRRDLRNTGDSTNEASTESSAPPQQKTSKSSKR